MELTPEEYKRRLGLLIAGGENPTVPGLNVPPPPAAIGTDPYQGWSQMGTPQTLPSTPSLSPYTQGYSMSGADHPSTPMPAPGVSAAATPAAAQTSIADMVSKEIGKQPATEDTAPTSVAGINESLGAQDVTGTEDTTPPEAAAPEGSSFGQRFVKGLATGGVDLPGMGVYRWTPSGGVMTTIGASTSGTDADNRNARENEVKMQLQARKANTTEQAALKETLAEKNAWHAEQRRAASSADTSNRAKKAIVAGFESLGPVKASRTAIAESDKALSLLNADSQLTDVLTAISTARAGGEKGALSEGDVTRILGRRGAVESLEARIQRAWNGRLLPEHLKEIREALGKIKDAATETLDKQAKGYAAENDKLLGTSKEEWYDRFSRKGAETLGAAGGGGGGGGRFSADGKTFTIPPEHETEFLKDHPDAKRL